MNKTVLITGASKGIGKALAEQFLDNNYNVIGTSRSGVIEAITHANFHPISLDISDQKSIVAAHKTIQQQFNSIDILINNAGIGPDLGFEKPERNSFKTTFEVNVEGVVFFTEPLIGMISSDGMIVNISSKMGSVESLVSTGSIAYRMSKSALNMYSKELSNRLKGNPRVAVIHPGWVKTTIMMSNLEHAPLTPKESASSIYDFLTGDFKTGSYYDAEDKCLLPW